MVLLKDTRECLNQFVSCMTEQVFLKGEINWINALKAICIVFIYVHHCEFYCEQDLGLFRAFYMPFFTNAFFFVSGYLLFRKQLSSDIIKLDASSWMTRWGGQYLRNVMFKLVIPTMLFTAIAFIPKMIIRGGDMTWLDCIKAILLGESYWFTCALVVSELLLFIFLLARSKSIWTYLLFGTVTIFVSLVLNHFDVRFLNNDSTPWYYKSGLVATFFLAIGGLYWKYEENIDTFLKGRQRLLLVALLAVYVFVTLCFSENVDCIITNGTINLLGLLMMLISTCLLVYVCKLIPSNAFITYIGRHSIGFYFFCGAIPNILAIILFKFGFPPSVTTTLICSAIAIGIAYPVVYIVNRLIPFIFDIRLIRSNLKK